MEHLGRGVGVDDIVGCRGDERLSSYVAGQRVREEEVDSGHLGAVRCAVGERGEGAGMWEVAKPCSGGREDLYCLRLG